MSATPPFEAASPLAEVEKAVQAQAKDLALDVGSPEGARRLRALVETEVARWSAEAARGLRPHDLADPAAVVERAVRNLAGYGPLEELLADDDVWEIMVNGPDGTFGESSDVPSHSPSDVGSHN